MHDEADAGEVLIRKEWAARISNAMASVGLVGSGVTTSATDVAMTQAAAVVGRKMLSFNVEEISNGYIVHWNGTKTYCLDGSGVSDAVISIMARDKMGV